MANSERIYLIQGNDTDMSVCLRKGGDTPLPYDLTGASRIGLALTGHGLSFFARDIEVSGEDNNIISGLLAGDLLVGEYGLEVSFTLDGKAKRFRVPQIFEVVTYLSEDQDGTAEGEGDGISITVTVQPEVIEIAGPTGPQGHDGKSAYEVWLDEGHTGTEDDFFKWLASEGLPWNDVDISSLTVRNGYITSSGVWNSGSTYCHTLLPVSAGKAVRVTAAESNLFRYAWLTSGQAPRGGIAADLVPGTERTDVAAGSSVTLDVPEGAKYLYIYLGTPADKANTPESLAVSDTIPSLRKDIDSTGADVSDIDDRIGYPGVYGALEGAGTAIVYARQVNVAGGQSYRVNMLHPDVTVTSPTGNAYRFVVSARNGEGAELSKLVQVVDTAALKDYYDITAPDGTSYLLIYGRCSSGETCDFTVDPLTTRTYNDGDILTLNPDSEFQPKWQSASKPYYTSQNTNRPNCVRFLHLSDVHGNWANVRRFIKFYNHWVDNGFDITAINTGDTATDYLTDGVTGYTGIAGADKILGVIGNHDTRGAQGWQQYKGLEVYNALFAPLISGWGVVQPEGAAENGYCYYHKDYASNKLRLVVVDIMGYDDTEDAWLASVLASAKTAGYHVLIATHFAGGRSSAEASQPPYKKIDCQWSTMAGLASDSTQLNGYNSESYKMADTVHAFMEDGGIFCGYMCGHSHLEFIARLDKYPDQMVYTVGSSKSGKVHDYTHTAGTRMQDEFEIVAVDTDSKFVKLYKVGANYDRRGRLKDSICVSYDTHEVVGFPVTTEALAKEMDGKQEKLVSGENIKTINGQSVLGSGDIQTGGGSADAVKYTEQTLTDAQKTQARTNIAAASESEVSQLLSETVNMISIEWKDLVNLRDNSQLIPGMQYRITDYETTTAQAKTRAAGNPFDVVVLALSSSVLSEEARAIERDEVLPDTIYNPSNDINLDYVEDITKDGKIYRLYEDSDGWQILVDFATLDWWYNDVMYYSYPQYSRDNDQDEWEDGYEYGETIGMSYIPLYFRREGAKLNAWKIWYCLDNDTERFAWADNRTGIKASVGSAYGPVGTTLYRYPQFDGRIQAYPYAWGTQEDADDGDSTNFVYSTTKEVSVGSPLYSANYSKEGVVNSIVSQGKGVIYHMIDEWNNDCPYDFKNILFKRKISLFDGYPELDTEHGQNMWIFTFAANSYNIGKDEWSYLKDGSLESPSGHQSDKIGSTFHDNKMGKYIMYFDVGNEDYTKCGKQYLNDNVFFGWWEEVGSDDPDNDTYYSAQCSHNCSLDVNCYSNTFDVDCYSNTFGNDCYGNIFRIGCYGNTFGDGCYSNTFGNYCYGNTFGVGCVKNTFGENCYDNTFFSICIDNIFANDCYSNTFGGSCSYNTFASFCRNNTFGNYCKYNILGNSCVGIKTGNSSITKDYYENIIVDNGNEHIYLYCSNTTSGSHKYKNIHIGLGVNNSSTYKTITDSNTNQDYQTEYLSANSQTISV